MGAGGCVAAGGVNRKRAVQSEIMEDSLLYARAPGKLNLYLKITGRRADGYHTLESLFLPLADPGDDIAIDLDAAANAITVGCSDFTVPGGMNNLAGRAAQRWALKAAVAPGWDINIAKHIPVAAGMGGGSSDAATVMRMLNDHYGQPLAAGALAEAALALGADVPFFLAPQPAVMTGIGEIAAPLDFDIPELPLLLLAPEFPVSAAEAYRRLAPETIGVMDDARRATIFTALRAGDWPELGRALFNDLQAGVFAKYPLLALLAEEMRRRGALSVNMTGSGPTLFALFASAAAAREARTDLAARYPEFRVMVPRQWRHGDA